MFCCLNVAHVVRKNFEYFDALWIRLDTKPQRDGRTDRNPISISRDINPLITGHYNTQIDCMADGWEDVIGPEGTGHWSHVMSDIGQRSLNLCAANQLKVKGSLFWHKNIKWT